MKYQVMVMSFDGDYKIESSEFDTIQEAWGYANDMGSRWYFYPFCFVISGKTIKDTAMNLEWLRGKRVKSVAKIFKKTSEMEETQNMQYDDYVFALCGYMPITV